MNRPVCACCKGRRVVPAIDGGLRPCSRCRADDFSRWARVELEAARDVRAAEEALADFDKNGGVTLEDLKREIATTED